MKCEELVDVYGSIDELNSWIGLVASRIEAVDVQQFLSDIQKDLFLVGSTLAGWKNSGTDALGTRVKQMEGRIDAMEKETGTLRNFILPGGSELGAQIHLVRAIVRRVERQAVALFQSKTFMDKGPSLPEKQILMYLNRLSDLFFMLARFINKQAGAGEVIWSGIPRSKNNK